MVDTIRYSDICGETGMIIQAAEIEFRITQIDVKDCNVGAFGSLNWILGLYNKGLGTEYGSSLDCQTKNYLLSTPITRIALDSFGINNFLHYEAKMA